MYLLLRIALVSRPRLTDKGLRGETGSTGIGTGQDALVDTL